MSRKRLLLLASSWSGSGGIQVYTREVVRVLRSQPDRWEVHARSYLEPSTSEPPEEFKDCASVASASGSRTRLIELLVRLPRVDLAVVLHVGLAPLGPLLKILGKVHAWGVVLYGFEAWERWSYLKRNAVRSAAFVVPISNYTAQLAFERNGAPRGRVVRIPPWSPLEERTMGQGFELDGTFRILCVTRLNFTERYKGVDLLIEAVALLQGNPIPVLHVLGPGGDRARLEAKAADLGIGSRVRFWGEVLPEALVAAYRQADVFALPSSQEGFGIVYLEAMLHGVPCLGVASGATPELIEPGETGFLVPPEDPPALAAALERLRRDPTLRERLGRRGRERAQLEFGKHQFRSSWIELLESLKDSLPT